MLNRCYYRTCKIYKDEVYICYIPKKWQKINYPPTQLSIKQLQIY